MVTLSLIPSGGTTENAGVDNMAQSSRGGKRGSKWQR